MSFIDKILNPFDCKDLKAVSLPDPGPLTWTVSVLKPCSYAFAPASSAAICAAYGVDFLEPLKPFAPADDAGAKAYEQGLRTLTVQVKGPGSGRETALRSLQSRGFKILSIKDTTPMPHNGARPPKRRRV